MPLPISRRDRDIVRPVRVHDEDGRVRHLLSYPQADPSIRRRRAEREVYAPFIILRYRRALRKTDAVGRAIAWVGGVGREGGDRARCTSVVSLLSSIQDVFARCKKRKEAERPTKSQGGN